MVLDAVLGAAPDAVPDAEAKMIACQRGAGFEVFKTLMEQYRPKYFLHGHMHKQYGRNHRVTDTYQDTHIINAYERYVFDYETEDEEKTECTLDK
mgnify:CR=1 FL=1